MRLFGGRTRRDPQLTPWQREMLTTGLAGFCKHGIGMLDNCVACCPPAGLGLPADRPVVDVEAVQLAETLLKERDEARAELASVRQRYDEAQFELLQAGTLAQRLEAQVTRLAAENEALRTRPLSGELAELRRQADQDRRNAVVLEDRLAAAEGRPVGAKTSMWGLR